MTKTEIKEALKAAVAQKRENTQKRLEFKRTTPTDEPGRFEKLSIFWNTNSILKEDIRFLQLAYAFVRGRRYWECERETRDLPWEGRIAEYAGVSREEILAWLTAEITPEEWRSYRARLKQSQDKARALKAERAASRSAA